MYSTTTAVTLSLRDLLDKVDDYDIYQYCIGQFKLGKPFNSPLRTNDQHPSFAIFKTKDGALLYKDHGTGESGNAIKFLKQYKNITTRDKLERELLRIVRRIYPAVQLKHKQEIEQFKPSVQDFGIVRQPFTQVDKEYWKQFHISIDTLKRFNVFSIKYFLCNRVVKGTYKDTSPMYAYKVRDRFKIYRPLSSKYTKWRTNLTNEYIQGLAELPKEGGNLLIVTKSLKDVMCLYEMGFYAISPSSESTFIPDNTLKSLRSKWRNIVILYDRDKAGIMSARAYSKRYKLDAFFINKRFAAKDISDAVKQNSFNTIKTWLTNELKRYEL